MRSEILAKKIRQIPPLAGVYQYFDHEGKLLYVGKAKNLKNRIKSYFRFTPILAPANNLSVRIHKMITQVYDLDYMVVENEHDALILENSLIKQLKPKFNILLRDDKTYPYIYIDMAQPYPRFEITRKLINRPHIKYFGPYSAAATPILKALYASFKLIQQASCFRGKKACLFHQVNKCHAPCEGKISPQAYGEIVQQAMAFLSDPRHMEAVLSKQMQNHADNLAFEEALEIKKIMQSIQQGILKTPIDFVSKEDIDAFAIAWHDKSLCILKTFVRQGKVVATSYSITHTQNAIDSHELGDFYKRIIVEFYNKNTITYPKQIFTAHALSQDHKQTLEAFVTHQAHKKIPVSTPQIGTKKQLIQTIILNAQMLLTQNLSKQTTKDNLALQEACDLVRIPYRIEIFDNSHLQAQAKVGAMVVFDGGTFAKSDYKQYHLQTNDDYHQMQEMLCRRLDKREENPLPDLWILDGGQALLDLALLLTQSLGIDLDIIAIAKEKIDAKAHRAKGKAKDLIYTKHKILKLHTTHKALLFAQKMRDEAHRFAIKNHRKLKLKQDKHIALTDVKGVGEAKVNKLLRYFGSFGAIGTAPLEELQAVLNPKDAQAIWDFLHQKTT